MGLYRKIALGIRRLQWRGKNRHNGTTQENSFPHNLVTVGIGTYGPIKVSTCGDGHTVNIGNYCSIAQDVVFIINNDHPIHHASTFPFRAKVLGQDEKQSSKGDIVIGDDVWLATGACILSGVSVGQGAGVCARAVVTQDVPPYAIVAGVPAHVVKYRFSENVIRALLGIDYSQLGEAFVRQNIDLFCEDIDCEKARTLAEKLRGRSDKRYIA